MCFFSGAFGIGGLGLGFGTVSFGVTRSLRALGNGRGRAQPSGKIFIMIEASTGFYYGGTLSRPRDVKHPLQAT